MKIQPNHNSWHKLEESAAVAMLFCSSGKWKQALSFLQIANTGPQSQQVIV